MADKFCYKCQKRQSELSAPLKQCSKCKRARYCSTDCQKAAWREHKPQCISTDDLPDEVYEREAEYFLRADDPVFPEDEMIFFIKKTIPHLDDITLAGPFYPRKAIVEQIKGNSFGHSLMGFSFICDFAQDERKLARLRGIRAPLGTNRAHFIDIEVIEEYNPSMAARLPGPCYNVRKTIPFIRSELQARHALEGRSPHVRVKHVELCGCFATKEEALDNAEEMINASRVDFDTCERHDHPELTNELRSPISFNLIGRLRGGRTGCVMVQVTFDSGEKRYI